MVAKVRAIILDFDGVIVDSHSAHMAAWHKAYLDLFGAQLPSSDQIIGRAGVDIAAFLAEKMQAPERSRELYQYKSRLVFEAYTRINLLPGVREFMGESMRVGLPYAIGSNARSAFIDSLLKRHSLSSSIIVGFDQVKRPKPDPEPFVKCAQGMKIEKEFYHEIAVFDDSPIGLRAAYQAGMIPVGVEGQFNSEQLIDHGAKYTVTNLLDALNKGWIKALPQS